ncbi:nicotinate-nucleotide adenylyltransferase [Nitrosomonas ureae]|uniref:Probable nicotinate-nucleotide adenylyltransferase n=1 Tax=Nitrosomonas ureae TaxID=44577 RepID=A0A0S3AMB7_9PROT|nr:nicotinate-nucleotide adenylyltransferase [Nitrosomonas ureae]ALQ52040.1 nicotinate-nicotinamide nucleotide adenylyltransferase [Nitrosomonas ureae]SDT91178.1 nicotinate-nucleotide adenylyltransferase [Nitrosomonas ureae]SOD19504.1 nicotinate-nucleotide adenylyltransferase [Nitrosomonas ureae]
MEIIDKFPLTGIYGGTFDPIHYGHLRIAEELLDHVGLKRILFIPSGAPRLRVAPAASRGHRSAMVRLAIQDNTRFSLDEREVNRPGISTTIQSLREFRCELGDHAALCFILGIDAFVKIDHWMEWQELFALCHIILVARPGYVPIGKNKTLSAEIQKEFVSRSVAYASDLESQSNGFIYTARTSLLEISASHIRSLIKNNKSIRYLLPENVVDYIQTNRLYTGNL